MTVNFIVLGKLKEKYFSEACEEYKKRLSAFCKLNVFELAPERLSDNPSGAEIKAALSSEREKIFAKIPQGSFTVALCIEGKQISSEDFAKTLDAAATGGKSTVNFIIGSSFGLSEEVKNKADFKLSFSKMTFPHQFARVMLYEQLYRAFAILNGKRYHK